MKCLTFANQFSLTFNGEYSVTFSVLGGGNQTEPEINVTEKERVKWVGMKI